MNDTRSMNRGHRVSVRIAVVLCLLLAIGVVPMAAFAAPVTVSDVEATYLNSATINLDGTAGSTTSSQLDGGAVSTDGSVTTSKYGAHVLKFWSTDGTGGENTITAPFFVDEDVKPVVVCDIEDLEGTTVEVDLEATDNFNGSGVDFLCYRVDGGKIQTAMAPASLNAAKVLFARIAKIQTGIVVAAIPSITPTTPAPPNHSGPPCGTCHTIIVPTPETTTTPDPTGTPAPKGGVEVEVEVTGVGSHKIEYWAQDVARNASAHVVETFEIDKTATTVTLTRSASTIVHGHSVTFSGTLAPVDAAPATIRISYKKPGSSKWVIWRYVEAPADGTFITRWSTGSRTTRGTWSWKAYYGATTDFLGDNSPVVTVRVK